jgi:flagellar motility protein MotE (MotC chaperone)
LNDRQLQLSEKEKQLRRKRTELDQREQEIKEQQQQEGGSLGAQVSGEATGTDIITIFDNMSVSAAAEILNNTTDNAWIADLLMSMDEEKAAKILAKIEVDKAVVITRLMSQ